MRHSRRANRGAAITMVLGTLGAAVWLAPAVVVRVLPALATPAQDPPGYQPFNQPEWTAPEHLPPRQRPDADWHQSSSFRRLLDSQRPGQRTG